MISSMLISVVVASACPEPVEGVVVASACPEPVEGVVVAVGVVTNGLFANRAADILLVGKEQSGQAAVEKILK